MNRREVQMLTFPQHGDQRGHLVVVEGEQDIPFVVKRIFYMYGSDRDVVRGQHANRRSEFVLINVSGQSKIRVDDGLGNEAVTPDAVGPEALRNLIVTRHLKRTMPEVFAPFSTVSAIAPGVLGTTGMESAELLAAAVRQIQPDAVIAVDAVASCEPERLCAAVQLSTAGITPGSGVGNARAAIDRTTLGVPVLAIGVPTVMDLGGRRMKDGTIPAGMILTPRDIDAKIKLLGRWIGLGIDLALHEGLDMAAAESFLA